MKKLTILAFAISLVVIFIGLSVMNANDSVQNLLTPQQHWYSLPAVIAHAAISLVLSMFVAMAFTSDEEIYG